MEIDCIWRIGKCFGFIGMEINWIWRIGKCFGSIGMEIPWIWRIGKCLDLDEWKMKFEMYNSRNLG